ncbi:MAG: DMT family transporter [Gammaproteobacteria bacterium]|nr:DMT family transporter [Gammaproteobacteria bacterium]
MNWVVFIAALGAVVIFGGSAVATRVAVSSITALDVSIMRTIIGGLIAIPLALMLRIRLPLATPQKWLLLLSGFCGFIAFPLLFTIGVSLTTANHATMILAILPVLTGAIAMAWDRQTPAGAWWVGCMLAFGGEILLIYEAGPDSARVSIRGDLLVLVSTLFASLGYVAGARLQRSGYSARGTTFWGVGLFALLLLPVAPLLLDFEGLKTAGSYAWSGLIYQAIGVTIVAYILWYWALGTGGIARVGLFQFLQPLSGVILAWLVLSEQLSLIFLIASAIIMIGVILAFRAK